MSFPDAIIFYSIHIFLRFPVGSIEKDSLREFVIIDNSVKKENTPIVFDF